MDVQDVGDHLRTIVLEPGQYAIVEMSEHFSEDDMEDVREIVPPELSGRLLFVVGKVYPIDTTKE